MSEMKCSIRAERYHDICFGHRVVNHESKCRHLHGHNYRFYFVIEAIEGLDDIGRVLDFSVIKETLCQWLETHWDHKFLLFVEDPYLPTLEQLSPESIVAVLSILRPKTLLSICSLPLLHRLWNHGVAG